MLTFVNLRCIVLCVCGSSSMLRNSAEIFATCRGFILLYSGEIDLPGNYTLLYSAEIDLPGIYTLLYSEENDLPGNCTLFYSGEIDLPGNYILER